jgi:hypothetical protein
MCPDYKIQKGEIVIDKKKKKQFGWGKGGGE